MTEPRRQEFVLGDEPAGRLAQEQRSLRRIATLVASQASPDRVFHSVSEEAAQVLDVSSAALFRNEGDDTATIVGRVGSDGVEALRLGCRLAADEDPTIGQVLHTGAPARIDDYSRIPGDTARQMIESGFCSAIAAPIFVGGMLWGAVTVAASESLPPDAESRLAAFCELVSLAVASAQAREDLMESRRRIVTSGDEQRRKLERNLHDGAQQRLVSAVLELRVLRNQLSPALGPAAHALEAVATELDMAVEDLRELARGLHPAVLTDLGLREAIETLGSRLPMVVEVVAPETNLPPETEATAYYIVSETLTNVAKHAEATEANVRIHEHDGVLRLQIADDGCGGADASGGSGLVGLRDRAEAAGGTLHVVSPRGRGTVVTASLPLSEA